LGLAAFGRDGFEKIVDEPLNVIVGGQINEWIVTMIALHVNEVKDFYVHALCRQKLACVAGYFSFRVEDYH
jgi:hypothetical protein